jgi:translocation and assembly module TamB
MNFLRRQARTILVVALMAGVGFLVGFIVRYHVPRIKQWLLIEVESYSRTKLPVRVWPQEVEFQFFPVGLRLYNVRLLPQKGFETTLAATDIHELDISLSTWALLRGQLRLDLIRVKDADFNIILRKSAAPPPGAKGPSFAMPSGFTLDTIYQLPLNSIELEKVRFAVKSEETGVALQAEDFNLTLENQNRALHGDISTQSLKFKKTGDNPVFETDLATNFLFDEDGVYFSRLKLHHGENFFEGTGSVRGNLLKAQVKDVRARVRTDVNLTEISELARDWFRIKDFPQMKGELNSEAEFDFKPPKNIVANISLKTHEFQIEGYSIGNLDASGKINEKKLTISRAHLENSFGEITAENGDLTFNDVGDFKVTAKSSGLNLHDFLKALDLGEIPIFGMVKGNLPCHGELKSDVRKMFKVTCDGSIETPDFKVELHEKGEKPYNIVEIEKVKVDGSVTVDSTAVSFKTHLNVGSSQGDSDGVISYATGFKINYATKRINFADVKNLVGLRPEGFIAIKGNTQGTSKWATIDLSAEGDKFWLWDFGIGRAKFNMRYKKSNLLFDGLEGQFNASRFKADLGIDLAKDQIQIIGSSPYLEASDLQQIFSRKVSLPFAVTGTGSAQVKASGPLDFSHLSYDLTSSLFRGTIADEAYDQINFNVTSRRGVVDARKVNLAKAHSSISLTGRVQPTGQMALNVQSHNLQIEQSQNLSRLKTNLTGNLSFDMGLSGYILKPNIEMTGHVTQMTVAEAPAPDSDFKFTVTPKEFSGSGQLLGRTLSGDFEYPFSEDGVSHIKAQVNNWNFAQAFSVFSDAVRISNYTTTLTGNAEFEIPRKNWRLFSGHMTVDDIHLQNGKAQMGSTHPLSLVATKGMIQTKDFDVSGLNTYVRLQSNSPGLGQIGLSLEGKVDLALATLLTPFLDDLRGQTQFSLTLTGPIDHPTFAGSSFIQDGLVKLKGFPHAFEQMNGDATFTDDKIVLNSLKGRLGGGVFFASGNVRFLGLTNVPIDVRGTLNDCKFNIPEGYNTRGSGDFYVKGNWIPYTIGVNFDVESGNIEPKDLTSNKSVPDVKPSTYLPKFLMIQRFTPVQLAVNVNIPKELSVRMSVPPIDVRTKVTGRLKITGPPEDPLLSGHVIIEHGGQVKFQSNTFEVQSGILDWENADPSNPNLNVIADAKVTATLVNNETRDYNVHARVAGNAKVPKISMTSEPPLAENDLVSLLTLGFINDQQNTQLMQPQNPGIQDNSYQFGGALLNSQLGINRQLEDKLGVQFDYSSSYNQIDLSTHHKFTLRKQWTPVFGTSASRDMGRISTSDVKAEYKLNKKVSVIGDYSEQDTSGTTTTPGSGTGSTVNILELDLEYKREFK